MDSEYDCKFEEMKNYIPFLESMIKRLESSSSPSNPRQAQLDKIRSLRDLLLDKKKRMKMENLLKCEQVLVNLYAKVEQRDTLPGIIGAKTPSEPIFSSGNASDKQNLSNVRNKLKTVAKALQEDTLPEIARASETEEVCTPGSKEPALFQRRPNKASISPVRQSKTRSIEAKSPQKSVSKRSYTRVLVSPESSSRRWSGSENTPSNKPLFSRRSPKKSPHRYSPSYHKKERKKNSKQSYKPISKDLNITLKVPQESLNSLNTEDILSRIINCHDGDVDIATLRDLRSQILGELKQTGAKDDISDLILKSYKNKKRVKEKEEVEEGELSDSESEAIESIYGSLVVVDKDKTTSSQSKSSTEEEKQSRKIQICLVINSDKEGIDTGVKNTSAQLNDSSDFEMFDDKNIQSVATTETIKIKEMKDSVKKSNENQIKLMNSTSKTKASFSDNQNKSEDIITITDLEDNSSSPVKIKDSYKKETFSNDYVDITSDTEITEDKDKEATEKTSFKANFYKPLNDQDSSETKTDDNAAKQKCTGKQPTSTESQIRESSSPKITEKESSTEATQGQKGAIHCHDIVGSEEVPRSDKTLAPTEVDETVKSKETEDIKIQDSRENTEIPLLNLDPVVPAPSKEDVVSEIDILQALKNEILSESITMTGAEVVTPLLHQPKITKVSSAKEIMKKRISIEKYKEKSTPTQKPSLFVRSVSKEDLAKKQSLKLTEKECERFNFPAKLALDDSSDEEDDQSMIDNIYANLAPKSPEHDDIIATDSTPPIIIPEDPIKVTAVSSKADIDMRTFMPTQSPTIATTNASSEMLKIENKPEANKRPLIVDPRVRRELSKPFNNESSNPHAMNPERTPRPMSYAPSVTPSMTPNARTYDMTPSHQPFDSDDNSSQKHVYAPIFSDYDGRDYREKSITRDDGLHWEAHSDDGRKGRWEQAQSKRWDDRDKRGMQRDFGPDYKHSSRYNEPIDTFSKGAKNERYSDKRDDYAYNRLDHPLTPVHPFGRSDCPTTPTPSFGRLEGPMTPSHPFGRSECPLTPSHPFGRSECPSTPSHSFGRSDCPTTPSHPFGRSDCPRTPSHPFGRSECPMTPSHPFGRPELNVAPMTPSHPFGRSEYHQKHVKDPRLNRGNDYDFGSRHYNEESNRDRKSDRSYTSDSYRNYGREQSVSKNPRHNSYERGGRQNIDPRHSREPSAGRAMAREYEDNKFYTRERRTTDYHYESDSRNLTETGVRRNFQRAPSIGRIIPSEERFYQDVNTDGNNREESRNDKRLSVKPQTGHSFTIDTSVNSTFQEFLQKKGMQVFDYSFNSRRQRAASVGRTFAREPSVGRTQRESSVGRNRRETSVGRAIPTSSHSALDTSGYKKMVNFVRACSMGRDISDNKQEKSFKDIKADFESYSASYNKYGNKKSEQPVKKTNSLDPRSRKDMYEVQQGKKSQPTYSPRKNNRDPRMRREQQHYEKNKHRYDEKRKHHGIVYSSDNIAKGTILGTGYGVKNYKIPKIKRIEEKQETKDDTAIKKVVENKEKQRGDTDKLVEKKNKEVSNKQGKKIMNKNKVIESKVKDQKLTSNLKNIKDKTLSDNTIIQPDNSETKPNSTDNTNKRTTRSCRKANLDDEIVKKPRKNVKTIIDSDSDDDVPKKDTQSDIGNTRSERNVNDLSNKKSSSPIQESIPNKIEDDELDTRFGIDDLEIFTENISSDPVMANINALIADLDNDIDTSKSEDVESHFTREISLENMLQNINSSNATSSNTAGQRNPSFDNISGMVSKDLESNKGLIEKKDKSQSELEDITTSEECTKDSLEEKLKKLNSEPDRKLMVTSIEEVQKGGNQKLLNAPIASDKVPEIKQIDQTSLESQNQPGKDLLQRHVQKSSPLLKSRNITTVTPEKYNHNIVSTTDMEKDGFKNVEDKFEVTLDDRCSTPDSTINTVETLPSKSNNIEEMPDSTNEMHSDITSTNDQGETLSKEKIDLNTSEKETTPQLNSIGNLLSMLQDKTKIKELLSKLGDNSIENEKLKKKLERLSEIVSEDDDTHDETTLQCKDPTHNSEHSSNKKVANEKEIVENINQTECEDIIQSDSMAKANINEEEENTEEVNQDISNVNNTANTEQDTNLEETKKISKVRKMPYKRTKKGKYKRKKNLINKEKRVTRSDAANLRTEKPNRELKQLQESIKEMFLSDDILNATGIRMCRLAKLVDEKNTNQDLENSVLLNEIKPVVVLEKFKNKDMIEDIVAPLKSRKKPGPKPKPKVSTADNTTNFENKGERKEEPIKTVPKYKPGPKSKTRPVAKTSKDPYSFENDSVNDTMNASDSFDSENESLASSRSYGSSEVLGDAKKKPKRKRRAGWKSGIIKTNKKKKKPESTRAESPVDSKARESSDEIKLLKETGSSVDTVISQRSFTIPDLHCFTDKAYCFMKNVTDYACRLCTFSGNDIVHHYKKHHPHSEIPLSRMSPSVAQKAIEQCEEINFQAISKIPSEKYICRFCFKVFNGKKVALETFFWHVVSTHTGEYKQLCSECINVTRCPFNLDIPPPPKDVKGQLIGYICGKCNFTQISLENLKIHVTVRHDDEQTPVYTINLALLSKKAIRDLMMRSEAAIEQTRVLRSSLSNVSMTEASDERSDVTENTDQVSDLDSVQNAPHTAFVSPSTEVPPKRLSKLVFETDDNTNEILSMESNEVKVERHDTEVENQDDSASQNIQDNTRVAEPESLSEREKSNAHGATDEIVDCPHFKISYTQSGAKEYVCCINGVDSHYKTSLLISMKKHVQMKHSEIWDGYCFVCKVIVTTQGVHYFKECLQHLLDKHIDNIPVLEQAKEAETNTTEQLPSTIPEPNVETPIKSLINVRPLTDLLSKSVNAPETEESPVALPKIHSVVSLGAATIESSMPTSDYVSETVPSEDNFEAPFNRVQTEAQVEKPKEYKYEEAQINVMGLKHRVVLESMLTEQKLIKIFKCTGRFCSFTSNSADAALLHASTHQRIGGKNALNCAYCDFDCSGNAIDLVMHVFKDHGHCKYSCAFCFYRASASQLVRAHMRRAHPAKANHAVLETDFVTPVANESADMLPRELAVKHYICSNDENNCKFKTYIQGKFFEHLVKHKPPHLCHYCSTSLPYPKDVVEHMKTHDLKLYQCTWCIHGADNEPEFLDHSSTKHPTKKPQAYLRLITSKDGSKVKMVLPLAQLNKSKENTHLVVSDKSTEDPVREAERSIDLEKLIGSVLMSQLEPESENQADNRDDGLVFEPDSAESVVTPESLANELLKESLLAHPPRLVTPPPSTSDGDNFAQQLTPVLKTEPQDTTPVKESDPDVVLCLDSDEEDNRDTSENVIDLSDEEATPKDSAVEKIPDHLLYLCSKCNGRTKTLPAFKRHGNICYQNTTDLNCAHCPFKTDDRLSLYSHYAYSHGTQKVKGLRPRDNSQNLNESFYSCQVCNLMSISLKNMRKHFKNVHGTANVAVQPKSAETGNYLVAPAPSKAKPGVKRKLSTGTTETPPKRTRFGPQDLEHLPTKPILDELAYCSECEFSTKVRVNLVRHLQQHAEKQMVPQTAPVNPVPHLETNEKHFDKMVNLASSSVVTRAPDKQARDNPTVNLIIPPEAASQYPKYVPERQRHSCGAKDCSYISVDEEMLKRHWETLHAGSYEFHCVHCPPRQHLDTTKPLTASRIIAHLKMHDVRLYACSACPYYHYKRQIIEKHSSEIHKGASQVLIVREEGGSPQSAVAQPVAAPTMDLKPWQCGLCKFKSMLRPEVIEHCAKVHSTKMQFRCSNCPFRASTLENVSKHKSNSHPESTEEVILYYYREGSIPDEPDGTPRWLKQRQKMGITGPDVKTETPENTPVVTPTAPIVPPPPRIDLNIVKKELTDLDLPLVCTEMTTEDLLKKFGEYCDPNGLKYKCPLCKLVTEDSKEDMQSHLFEELKYRRWSCSICSYKAFHRAGLSEHMFTEHRQRTVEPKELPLDINIELWVANLLDHQTKIIEMHREKLTIQKVQNPPPTTSKVLQKLIRQKSTDLDERVDAKKLEEAFGGFGAPKNNQFCCPKCNFQTKDEIALKDHLESELNKIRWNCSNCSTRSQNYHEAQLHCKTCKGPGTSSSRPVEAIRDPKVREAWVTAAIRAQKLVMSEADSNPYILSDDSNQGSSALENSLLVVRYEQRVPTPEEEMRMRRKRASTVTTVQLASPDSDEERLIIDEPSTETGELKKRSEINEPIKQCPHCSFTTKYCQAIRYHILRHYDLRPFTCNYCQQTCQRCSMESHNEACHPGIPESFSKTKIPSGPPTALVLKKGRRIAVHEEDKSKEDAKVICLVCEKSISESEKSSHVHDKIAVEFAKRGDVVVKCCICLALLLDVDHMVRHHKTSHSNATLNYAFFKLHYDTREIHYCGNCDVRFKFIRDLRAHHNTIHSSLQLKYETRPFVFGVFEAGSEIESIEDYPAGKKSDLKPSPVKRVARKSTTKLPIQAVAKKSTTKLPFRNHNSDSEGEEEYSFYGTKPSPPDEMENVTALMPFCNTMMPFTFKKLSEIIKINPRVSVKDIKK